MPLSTDLSDPACAQTHSHNPFHGAAWLKCMTVFNGQKSGKYPEHIRSEHIRGLTDVGEHIESSVALLMPKPFVNNLFACLCLCASRVHVALKKCAAVDLPWSRVKNAWTQGEPEICVPVRTRWLQSKLEKRGKEENSGSSNTVMVYPLEQKRNTRLFPLVRNHWLLFHCFFKIS